MQMESAWGNGEQGRLTLHKSTARHIVSKVLNKIEIAVWITGYELGGGEVGLIHNSMKNLRNLHHPVRVGITY